MIDNNTFELYELLVALHEGDITKEQFEILNSKLKQKDHVRCYVEFISIFADLSCPSTVDLYFNQESDTSLGHADQDTYTDIMKKFAEEEINAQAIEIPQKQPQQELIQKVIRPKVVYKFDKRSLFTIIASVAAILLVVLFVKFAPVRGGQEVAAVSDCINAKWTNSHIPMHVGTRLMDTDPPFILREGYAELLFDNNAKIIVEGPAEFEILTQKQIRLSYGKLYAVIPDEAYGFIVSTRYSEIIDLGTEFGVQQSVAGDTEVHVIKGRTNLISGAYGNKINVSVTEGTAKRLMGSTGGVKDILCDTTLFVREIESKANLIWRGQETIDLADMTCGGNGFGGGNPETVIDPITGNTQPYVERGFGTRYATSSYSMTESLRYVDGVFVPDGGDGPIVISSAGTAFESCPDTSGAVRKDISVLNKIYQKDGGDLKLNDTVYGYPYRPAITIQANIGVTFDLDAIRKDMAGFDVTYFEALCAVASDTNEVYDTVAEEKRPAGKADFWILIDGRVQKTIQGIRMGYSEIVRLPIRSDDRFLTIMTTDHMESGELDPIGWDRCFLGDPVLGLESLD
jgi:hypothetical protein